MCSDFTDRWGSLVKLINFLQGLCVSRGESRMSMTEALSVNSVCYDWNIFHVIYLWEESTW